MAFFDNLMNNPQVMGGLMGLSNLRDPDSMGRALLAMQQMNQFNQRQASDKRRLDLEEEQGRALAAYRTEQGQLADANTKLRERELNRLIGRDDALRGLGENIEQAVIGAMQPQGFVGGMPEGKPLPPVGGVGHQNPALNAGGQPAPMQAPQFQLSKGFASADNVIKGFEGGYVANDAGAGPTKEGVNQKANPDIDVKNATPTQLMARRKQYWDAIGGDTLPPQTALVAYDTAINQGQDYARNLLQTTGGNPALMLQQRRERYRELAKSNPIYEKQLPGWEARLDKLAAQVGEMPAAKSSPVRPQGASLAPGMDADRVRQIQMGTALLKAGDEKGLQMINDALKDKKYQRGDIIRKADGSYEVVDRPNTQSEQAEEDRKNRGEDRADIKLGIDLAGEGRAQEKHPGELLQQGATLKNTRAETKRTEAAADKGELENEATRKAKETAKRAFTKTLADLNESYDKLELGAGITDPKKGPMHNLPAALEASGFGQAVGRVFATQNQSEREKIGQAKSILVQSLTQATGMSAKQLDTQFELERFLKAATDPKLDIEANRAALKRIEEIYVQATGDGSSAPPPAGTKDNPMSYEDARKKYGGSR